MLPDSCLEHERSSSKGFEGGFAELSKIKEVIRGRMTTVSVSTADAYWMQRGTALLYSMLRKIWNRPSQWRTVLFFEIIAFRDLVTKIHRDCIGARFTKFMDAMLATKPFVRICEHRARMARLKEEWQRIDALYSFKALSRDNIFILWSAWGSYDY